MNSHAAVAHILNSFYDVFRTNDARRTHNALLFSLVTHVCFVASLQNCSRRHKQRFITIAHWEPGRLDARISVEFQSPITVSWLHNFLTTTLRMQLSFMDVDRVRCCIPIDDIDRITEVILSTESLTTIIIYAKNIL